MHRLALGLLAFAFMPASAVAQIDLGVVGGFYAPTSDFTIAASPIEFGDGTAKQQTAFSIGALSRLWLSSRFGVEGVVLRSSSDVAVSPGFAASPDTLLPAAVTIGTLSAVFRFPLGDLSNPIWAAAGAAYIGRSGRAYRGVDSRSSLGGTIGLGTQFRLTSHLAVDVSFKGLFYNLSMRDAAGPLPSAFQLDLLGWAGLVYHFGPERDN